MDKNKTKFSKNKSKFIKKDKPDNQGTKGEGIPSHNDYSYYAIDDQIAKDLASLPFNYINGSKFPLTGYTKGTDGNIYHETTPEALPAFMVLDYVNAVGKADKITSGINMAAVQLYTYIRHQNSGARNYEAPDVMMYVLAMRDIYSDYFELRRILGLTRLYSFYNHNLPDLLISSLGFNPKDVRANLASYRGQLNQLVEKINSFAVPKYFKIFERSAYIANNVFSDSNSMRGQIYAMRRVGRYTWSSTESEQGTSLVFSEITVNPATVTFQDRINALESQLDAIYLDEDATTMSGDILKAFNNESELYQVQNCADDLAIVPVFDENMLAQFENSVTFSPVGDKEVIPVWAYVDMDVKQNSQYIIWEPKITYNDEYSSVFTLNNKYIFNSHKDNPDYKDVLEWSRLMCTYDPTIRGVGEDLYLVTHTLTSCGCELPMVWNYYRYVHNVDGAYGIQSKAVLSLLRREAVDTRRLTALSQFDWHPFIYIYEYADDPSGPAIKEVGFFGDIKVATTIDFTTLKNINDSAVYATVYARNLYNK